MTRFSVLLVFATIFGTAAEPPKLPAELTLAQALNIALQNSTNIRTAMAQLDQASGRYEQPRSPLIPQLDINAHEDYLTVNLAGLASALQTAIPSRADYHSAEATIKAAELQVRSQSKVGGKGQRGWPDEVHQQLVRHRRLNPLTGLFCCPLTFRSGTLLSAVGCSLVAPFAHCQALPHYDIPHTSGPITIDGKADDAAWKLAQSVGTSTSIARLVC